MTHPAHPRTVAADLMVRHPKALHARSTLSDASAFFADDHVHMALVVGAGGRLLTTVERADLPDGTAASTPLTSIGRLEGRTVPLDLPMVEVMDILQRAGGRRLAVIDRQGRLHGLLCLKRRGTGFCSDAGIASRAAARSSRTRSEITAAGRSSRQP